LLVGKQHNRPADRLAAADLDNDKVLPFMLFGPFFVLLQNYDFIPSN